ncbi:MAG: membrane protein insertase YidC [Flavipsychrobacter sp.]|nr:membrane protein insertase YidC [Flavipsychrobacter sp.]
MDRNSVIGFGLLILLLIGYVSYNNYSQNQFLEKKKADSVAYAKAHPKANIDSLKAAVKAAAPVATTADSAINDSLRKTMPAAYYGQASNITLENKDITLTLSTKGAHPVGALLKAYKTHDQKPLYFFNGESNQLSAVLPDGKTATADLFFTASQGNAANGDKTVDFVADLGNGKAVQVTYTLPNEGYMIGYKMTLKGMPGTNLPLTWHTAALHTENDLNTERTNAQVYYRYTDNEHDYFSFINTEKETLDKPVHWVGFRSQYFSTALINTDKEAFKKATVGGNAKLEDKNTVALSSNSFDIALNNSNEQTVNLNWYIGPNKYSILRSYKIELEDMVPLGYGVMAFVKYVNKWLIIPIFNVLSGFISNYGIIIILMTLIIRLILSFFTYKSYLSAAKMRVLKPEIDELRAQYSDDQQKFGMEQMKLYRSAGVNPLGGCLPTLFQLPILFAMYYFFPTSIELRQQKFLWANDLSTYDSIISWGGDIPVISSIFGNHISLFTILMTASSLFLALYNRNMTVQDPNNPMLKWMPYIFPFLLFGVFNKMAAALTFYYFASNMISIAQQFVIQKYIINEKAIHAQLQENKNKPATKSKWAERMEQMQQAQMEKAKQARKK